MKNIQYYRTLFNCYRYKKNNKTSADWINQGKGKKLSILANGPSQRIYYDYAKNVTDDIICCNFMALFQNDLLRKIKPQFYCLIDNAYFCEDGLSDELIKQVQDLMAAFEEIDWEMSIITWDNVNFKISNPKIKFIYLSHYFIENIPVEQRFELYEKNMASCNAWNVSATMIQFGIQSGYDKINIWGLDLSFVKDYFVDENNRVIMKDKHAYKQGHTENGDVFQGTLSELLNCYVRMLKNFEEMKLYGKQKGVEIENHNPESYVDSFTKNITLETN